MEERIIPLLLFFSLFLIWTSIVRGKFNILTLNIQITNSLLIYIYILTIIVTDYKYPQALGKPFIEGNSLEINQELVTALGLSHNMEISVNYFITGLLLYKVFHITTFINNSVRIFKALIAYLLSLIVYLTFLLVLFIFYTILGHDLASMYLIEIKSYKKIQEVLNISDKQVFVLRFGENAEFFQGNNFLQ